MPVVGTDAIQRSVSHSLTRRPLRHGWILPIRRRVASEEREAPASESGARAAWPMRFAAVTRRSASPRRAMMGSAPAPGALKAAVSSGDFRAEEQTAASDPLLAPTAPRPADSEG